VEAVIIARETLKRLYGVGADLNALPVDPEAVERLGQLAEAAIALTAPTSVAEVSEAFALVGAVPDGLEEAVALAAEADRELAGVWSGPAQATAAQALVAVHDRLVRIQSAAQAAGITWDRLLGRVDEVNRVIRQGAQHLAQAKALLPQVVSAAGLYGDQVQFEALFQQARKAALTGTALVHQAYARFDVVCAEARTSLTEIAQGV